MSWNPKDIPIERPSSFDEKGRRVFLYPAKVKGYYKNLRTSFYFLLLFLFLVVPWTQFNGEQTLLFDIAKRRFVFFGTIFSAQDGPLIFFPLILASLGLGFVTSVWGRVWCGWACPQTVFLEAIFRRIDQWVEGPHNKRLALDKAPWTFTKVRKKLIKWSLFLIVCSHITHSFTAYFVGAKSLFWLTATSPLESWSLFVFVQVLTLILLFNFGWFRDQFCIIMCPYGRFQSVLMGQQSLAVLYDEKRGEPRRQKNNEPHGDCVNCYKCVSVCPMGIDIRRGLQMECIGCTACIDACDEIMEKIEKPKGLIRYTSLAELSGEKKNKLNLRSFTYLGAIVALVFALCFILYSRKPVDLNIIRAIEAPYSVVGEQLVNHFKVVITNQGSQEMSIGVPTTLEGEIISPELPAVIKPGEHKRVHFFVKLDLKGTQKRQSDMLMLKFELKSELGESTEIIREIRILKPE